ncbi:MAG: ferredoxin [Marinibacterium sp.]|nr:ferredoxin [Marinibacterium sp.]
MTPDAIAAALAPHGLMIMGVAHPQQDGITSALIVGMDRGAWPAFTAAPEYRDGAPDPLDRWSKRLLGAIAQDHGLGAVYPSDGPPYPPVIAWALASGRFWQSPAGMMVHDVAGLMISIRGVLTSPAPLRAPPSDQSLGQPPCDRCAAAPCRSTCPVDALDREAGYDVPACTAHLATPQGTDCLTQGCRARRACPISQAFGRQPDQSAFHMKAFFPQ